MKISIKELPIVSLKQVEEETGWDLKKVIKKSGTWKLLSGSRGYFEEAEYIDDLNCVKVNIPSKKECKQEYGFSKDYIDEFWGYEYTDNAVQFGCTEEEYDIYYRIAL